MTGTIARENATRNPKRTSATASALMVGVGLVVFITVFGASARASIEDTVDTAMEGDWIVDTTWGQGGLNPEVGEAIAELPEVAAMTPMRFSPATVDGGTASVSAFLPGPMPVYDTLEPMGGYATTIEAFEANGVERTDSILFVANTDGVSMAEAHAAIEAELTDYPTAVLLTAEEFTRSVASAINQFLNLVYALLALAVLIALFGIANTLGLSVHERTRELGLLRAVGMARSQVRSAVRWESVIISLLGTALGLAIGLGFAWALVQAMEERGFSILAVPGTQLATIVALAATAGVVTAILPARKAAKVDVLRALSTA
jgi:putative ABC transport system permease protein